MGPPGSRPQLHGPPLRPRYPRWIWRLSFTYTQQRMDITFKTILFHLSIDHVQATCMRAEPVIRQRTPEEPPSADTDDNSLPCGYFLCLTPPGVLATRRGKALSSTLIPDDISNTSRVSVSPRRRWPQRACVISSMEAAPNEGKCATQRLLSLTKTAACTQWEARGE